MDTPVSQPGGITANITSTGGTICTVPRTACGGYHALAAAESRQDVSSSQPPPPPPPAPPSAPRLYQLSQ
jgi:hypothetical protein